MSPSERSTWAEIRERPSGGSGASRMHSCTEPRRRRQPRGCVARDDPEFQRPGGRGLRRIRRSARNTTFRRCAASSRRTWAPPKSTPAASSARRCRGCCTGCAPSSMSILRPTAMSRSWPPRTKQRAREARLLRRRGDARDPPERSSKASPSAIRHAVFRQPQEVRRSARSARSTRCRSRAASRCSSSNWIRDMGEFYGANLFLAESSATTGGLDSLLEPTGNIKQRAGHGARALRRATARSSCTNGTSTSNKIVRAGAAAARRHRADRSRTATSRTTTGCVLAGAQPYYVEAFPLDAVLDVRQPCRCARSSRRCSSCKAEGKLDRVKHARR